MAKSFLSYSLTLSARADLKEIAKRTVKKWGKKQAAIYANRLEQCFQEIAKNKLIYKSFSKRYPQIRCVKCEHHFVFYLHEKAEGPVVIAVLYEHMDILSRLTTRFSGE